MRKHARLLSLLLIIIIIINTILSNSQLMLAYAGNSQISSNDDNNVIDWDNIQPIAIGSGNITSLSAVQKSDTLYILILGSNLNTMSNIYIDSDDNGSTGFHSWAWQNSGIDYMIENESLYSYSGTGSDWAWNYQGTILIDKNDSRIEISIESSFMGSNVPRGMRLSFCRAGTDYLPEIGQGMSYKGYTIPDNGTVEYDKEISKSAGILNKNGTLTLDTKYNQSNKFNIYYGELQYSGITDYSIYDFLIVYDRNIESVNKARSQGCKIFQYLYFGSRFEDTDIFISNFKKQILDLKNNGLADGIFLDECDADYWELGYSRDQEKSQIFYNRLKEVTDYCKSIGVQTVVNGARVFCDLGDYYLWESFQGYWTTNSLKWSNTSSQRNVSSVGEINYGLLLSDWTLSGSCYYDGQSIRGGANGSAEILIDMDSIVQQQDKKDIYDWVYFEWFGIGADDNNCSIWVWTGDELPFSENTWDGTWRKLPKLWKGEAESWNGIGKSSRYLKIKMLFNGADNLKMDSILLTYDYKYPYWQMNNSNGQADTNPYLWNYNVSQRDYLWKKTNESGNKVKVLTHSYGDSDDDYKKRYTFLSSEIWGFHSFDYVHPMMQSIYENNIIDEPIGMLLNRIDNNTGNFTGATASIDLNNHTYTLERNEPGYWYDRAAIVDGETNEWASSNILYQHTGQAFNAYSQWWGANTSTYNQGTFDNIKIENRDGNNVLELVTDGSGTWTSPVIKAYKADSLGVMKYIYWNYGDGSAIYQCKYKLSNGHWTDWSSVGDTNSTPNVDFKEFQVKVELTGKASYTDYIKQRDENGETITKEVFHQGVSFWGSSHTWDIYLPENINIKNFMVNDDNKYLYISYEVEGQIDFSHNPNLPSNYNYNIYLNTTSNSNSGYIGEWWKTTFGSNYRISNSGIFKWDDSWTDRTDYNGWNWIGSAGMTYKLSEDKKTIEYRIKKESLGGLEEKDLKVFMQVDESASSVGNLVNPFDSTEAYYNGFYIYSQKSYNMNTPHGWYCSEEQVIDINDGYVYLDWEQKRPEGTDVKAWIRTRKDNENWSNWQEAIKGVPISGTFNRLQYCFGLFTDNGDLSPAVSAIEVNTYNLTDEPLIKIRGNTLTYTPFQLFIATKNKESLTVKITGPNDYSDTNTYYRENTYINISEYFTYPGDYTIVVNNAGKEVVKKITIELSEFDEAYQMLELIRHDRECTVMFEASGEDDLLFEAQQNAFYTMLALLENEIIKNNSYVSIYLATRLLDGDMLSLSDINTIKNSLMVSDDEANTYFTQWEQKRDEERTSLALNMIPFIGGIKGFIEGVDGRDLITGRKLAWWECAVGIIAGSLDVVGFSKLASVALVETKTMPLLLRLEVIAGKISKPVAEAIEAGIRLKTFTKIEDALTCVRNVSVDVLDSVSLTKFLSDVDGTAFSIPEKATLKSEILRRAGFTNFDKSGTLDDAIGFTSLNIEVVELQDEIILFRRGYPDEPISPFGLGRWYGDKYRTIDQVRNELAVCEAWGNPLTGEYTITVPKGTKVLKGTAAPQTITSYNGDVIEYRAGGGVQYWLNDIPTAWLVQ